MGSAVPGACMARLFPAQEIGSHRTSNEEINLQEVYGFFTSDAVAQGFVINIIGQLMFTTAGWFLSSHLWSLARGDGVSTETDFGALQDFLLSDQTAVINVALG